MLGRIGLTPLTIGTSSASERGPVRQSYPSALQVHGGGAGTDLLLSHARRHSRRAESRADGKASLPRHAHPAESGVHPAPKRAAPDELFVPVRAAGRPTHVNASCRWTDAGGIQGCARAPGGARQPFALGT